MLADHLLNVSLVGERLISTLMLLGKTILLAHAQPNLSADPLSGGIMPFPINQLGTRPPSNLHTSKARPHTPLYGQLLNLSNPTLGNWPLAHSN